MARVVAVLLGFDHAARHHDHPLLLLVAADHPDGAARDQGRRGRRLHLGRRRDVSAGSSRAAATACRTPRTRCSPTPRPAPPKAAEGGADAGTTRARTAQLPDVYIAMGQTAENVAQLRGDHPGRAGRVRRALPEPGREGASPTGFWEREITPVTLPDGTVVSADDGPRAGHDPGEGLPRSSRCSGRTARSPPATAARSTTAPPRWWS